MSLHISRRLIRKIFTCVNELFYGQGMERGALGEVIRAGDPRVEQIWGRGWTEEEQRRNHDGLYVLQQRRWFLMQTLHAGYDRDFFNETIYSYALPRLLL